MISRSLCRCLLSCAALSQAVACTTPLDFRSSRRTTALDGSVLPPVATNSPEGTAGAAGNAAVPLDGSLPPGNAAGTAGMLVDAGSVPRDGFGPSDATAVPAPLGPLGNWTLTLREECDAPLAAALWNTQWNSDEVPPRTLTHTLEYVADDHVSVTNGECVIVAEDLAQGGEPYTSGTLNTARKFEQLYGYFEARLQSGKGTGLWTDWRLRAVESWPPAIDVVNVFGRAPNEPVFQHYWGPEPTPNNWRATGETVDLSLDFHVFGVHWEPARLTWYLDGQEVASVAGEQATPQDRPLYLSLALLTGNGEERSPTEAPDQTTLWPVQLRIDWIRVYTPAMP